MKSKISALYAWVDERTGIRELTRHASDEPIRGGARWAYVFGSVLVFLFLLQIITGIFLTMYYVPSADHAHTSVAYIQKVVPGGAIIRGLHAYGASAMVIFLFVHLIQTFLFGSYKGKRELLWGVGVVMILIVLDLRSRVISCRGIRRHTSGQKWAQPSPAKFQSSDHFSNI